MVPREQAIATVRSLLTKSKDQIALALPRHMDADRMLRIVMTSVQRTPKLLECDPKTLVGAVIQSAQLGLEPDGVLGHAYLVPYGNVVQFIPGYKGLIDLARRSGHVESLQARVVYENDEFDFAYGDTPFLKHKPAKVDGGSIIAVYAVACLKGGEKPFEVMWKAQVDGIRARSKAANNGPWVTDYEEMARKTAVRRLCKYLPLSVEVARAVALDELAERGLPQNLEVLDVTHEEPAPPKPAIERLTEKIGPGGEVIVTTAEADGNGETAEAAEPAPDRPVPGTSPAWLAGAKEKVAGMGRGKAAPATAPAAQTQPAQDEQAPLDLSNF